MADEHFEVRSTTSARDELEKLAEGLESRNFHFISICLKKVIDTILPDSVARHTTGDEAFLTDGLAEAHKVVKALDSRDCPLAAICLRKAIKAYAANPPQVEVTVLDAQAFRRALDDIASSLNRQEFSGAANYVRRAAEQLHFPGEDPRPQRAPAAPEPEAAADPDPVEEGSLQ